MEKHKENELESGMEELELVLAGEEQAAPLVSAEEDFVLPELEEGEDVEIEVEEITPEEPLPEKPLVLSAPRKAMSSVAQFVQARQERAKKVEENTRANQTETLIVKGYVDAMKMGTNMTGVISSVETHDNTPMWVIYDGPVTVFIPFDDAVQQNPRDGENLNAKLLLENRIRLLTSCIGCEIPFSVETIQQGRRDGHRFYYAYGSRLKAQARIRKRYFGPGAKEPVRYGQRVEATVLGVGEFSAFVMAKGKDFKISASHFSYNAIMDLRDVYAPGDKVEMEVVHPERFGEGAAAIEGMPVEVSENGTIKCTLDVWPIERKEAMRHKSRVKVGNRYHANIACILGESKRDEKTGFVVRRLKAAMMLDGVRMPAYALLHYDSYESGEEEVKARRGRGVLVEVVSVSEYGFANVRIRRYL